MNEIEIISPIIELPFTANDLEIGQIVRACQLVGDDVFRLVTNAGLFDLSTGRFCVPKTDQMVKYQRLSKGTILKITT